MVRGAALGGALGMVGGISAAVFVSVIIGFTDLDGGIGNAVGIILAFAVFGSIYGAFLGCVLGATVGLLLGALRAERHAPVVSALTGVALVVGSTGGLGFMAVVAAGFGVIGWAVGTGFARACTPRASAAPGLVGG